MCDAFAPKGDPRLSSIPHVFEGTPDSGTAFRTAYEAGRVPATILRGTKPRVAWVTPIEEVNVVSNLPLFLDGVREKIEPFRFVACTGASELIACALPADIVSCLPDCVVALRKALVTQDRDSMAQAVILIKELTLKDSSVAKALVPFYRMLLTTLSKFKGFKRCTFDRMDFAKKDGRVIGELIEETLDALAATGGAHAVANIKYLVAEWEYC